MVWEGLQEVEDRMILAPGEKRVVPRLDHLAQRNRPHFREIHDHALPRIAGRGNELTGKRDFEGVTVPVQVTATALVVRDAMTRVELQSAGNAHWGR